MAGCLWWISANIGQACVVIIVNVSKLWPCCSQESQSPANDRGSSDTEVRKKGCLPPAWFIHSNQPSTGIRQRRVLKALLKDGFSCTVSARALIRRDPILESFAQKGMRPQRRSPISLTMSLPKRQAAKCWVGAPLYRGRSKPGTSMVGVWYRN